MNRTRLLAGLAAASLMLIAGAASAQDARPALMRADTDGDSRLSKAEFVEARIAPLVAMDADRDGAVTPAERAAARQARAAAAATRRFDKLDADKDGVVSRAEFEAAAPRARRDRAGMRARHQGARQVARRAGPRAARSGPDAGQARAAPAPILIADVRARAEAAFDRLDADRDGFLVRTEMQAARAALRDRREARRGEMKAGDAQAGTTREARREARRLRRENIAPASPPSPASE